MKLIRSFGVIFVMILAALVGLASPASAACGTAAQAATYKTVKTPGTPAVYDVDKVVLDSPATPPVEEVSHIESVLVTPAVEEVSHIEHRLVTPEVPPTEEVSHIEHRLVTPGTPEVAEVSHQECDTIYHFRKFVQTRTKAPTVAGFWQEFSPTKPKTFTGPPTWPIDPRGKWSAPKTNGGPQQGASGVFQNGGGNGSWFYRAQPIEGQWSDYGPWTAWVPALHEEWRNSPDPVGVPLPHASGTYSDGTKWERVWQVRFDGQTDTVNCRKVIDVAYQPAVPPVYEDVKVIDVAATPGSPAVYEDVKVIDVEAKPAVYEDVKVIDVEAKPGTPEVSHVEKGKLLEPATPATSKQVLVKKAVAAGEPCKPNSPPPALAFTGLNVGGYVTVGVLALLAGIGITLILRRRSA